MKVDDVGAGKEKKEMILKQYYRDEIAEYVRSLPEESFWKSEWRRSEVLQDQGILEQL